MLHIMKVISEVSKKQFLGTVKKEREVGISKLSRFNRYVFINHKENALHIETKVCCPNTITLLKYKTVRNSDARNFYIFRLTLPVFLSCES